MYNMDWELEYTMRMLFVGKLFYDHGRFDELMEEVGELPLEPYALCDFSYITMLLVFKETYNYYNEGKRVSPCEWKEDKDVYVFRDPQLSRFDALCREYERRYGISKVENPFARDLEELVHSALNFSSCYYEYLWYDGTRDRKGPKIVLMLDEEFDGRFAVTEALFRILDHCKKCIPKLEKELAKPDQKVIPLPVMAPKTYKEAA